MELQMNQTQGHQTESKFGIYHRSILTRKIVLKINQVGRQLKQNLEKMVVKETEGKCIPEGYIRPNSVNILEYSSGNVCGQNVAFTVMFECLVCHPVANMIVDCICTEITLGGIHAEVRTDGAVPMIVFMMTDHNYSNKLFGEVKEGMRMQAKILGIRFELNDPYITAVGQLVDPNYKEKKKPMNTGKPKLRIEEDVDDEL